MSSDFAPRRRARPAVDRDDPPAGHAPRSALYRWGVAGASAAAATTGVAVLAEETYDRAPGAFDARVHAWALAHRTPRTLDAFEWITRVGQPAAVTALAVVAAVWLWRARARTGAIVVVAAPLVAIVTFNVIKQIVHRTRPAGGLLLRTITYSFPSGHAAASTAVFVTLGWVLARERLLPWAVTIPLAIVCPLLIGLSRIDLGVHWATDVLAGWCLGLAVAALAIGVYERGRQRAAPA